MDVPDEARSHYSEGREHSRLESGAGRLEFLRSLAIIERFSPPPPAKILDLGGGTGPYAFALASRGYEVDLLDLMPNHIEQARANHLAASLRRIDTADARHTDYDDATFDVVLLMGPLYHLLEEADRVQALRECHRVLRPEGVLLAAAISKYASLLDGYWSGLMDDPVFESIARQDLVDGQHRNPTNHPGYFTSTKFHAPDELLAEIRAAGFPDPRVFAVEGFGWLTPGIDDLNPKALSRLVEHVSLVEEVPEMLGVSAHLMAVAAKK